MNFIQENYIVYIKTDEQNRIININSSAFLDNTESWIKIDEGLGDKYHHAQGNYFDEPIYTTEGIPRYKLVDGKPAIRTEEEISKDISSIAKEPTELEKLRADIDFLSIMTGVEL